MITYADLFRPSMLKGIDLTPETWEQMRDRWKREDIRSQQARGRWRIEEKSVGTYTEIYSRDRIQYTLP